MNFYIKKCGFVNKEDLWDQVQDFNWLKQEKSPNFDILNDQTDDYFIFKNYS